MSVASDRLFVPLPDAEPSGAHPGGGGAGLSFAALNTIRGRILSIVAVGIIGSAIVLFASVVAMRAFDRLVLLARGERDHSVHFDRANVDFERYVRTGNYEFYKGFQEHGQIALGISSYFGVLPQELKTKSHAELAEILEQRVPTFDYAQSLDFVRMISILRNNVLVRDLSVLAAQGARDTQEYMDLAEKYTITESAEAREQMLPHLIVLREKVVGDTQRFSTGIGDLSDWALWRFISVLLISSGALIGLGLWLALRVARSIIRPLASAVRFADDVANGNLCERLELESVTETMTLCNAMNGIAEKMGGIIANLSGRASQLSSASEELSAISEDIAAGAEQMLSETLSVSATSEQVGQSASEVARNVDDMDQGIRGVANNAAEAARVAGEAVKLTRGTTAAFERLKTSSSEIGDVIRLISSVAEQTNLLALNATIEAARAGEAGKGFAVVAQEVKALASQTSHATDEIDQKIKAIQSDVTQTISAIEKIGEIVLNIDSLQTVIAKAVGEQSQICGDIRTSVQQTARDGSSISGAISGVAEAARSTTEGTHQTLAAAHELSLMASNLKAIVAQFRYAEAP
ncbi:MAG: methyl-accepting chemotaxis protein [bacterium]|nr:methyl-accepting chemotaxis protein [bacterium]